MAAARGGVDGRGRTRGRRWRGQGGESMDKAGRGGGEEEKTVALCVGPEISLPLGVRGEEHGGERSRLVSCMFYLPYLESVRKTPFFR